MIRWQLYLYIVYYTTVYLSFYHDAASSYCVDSAIFILNGSLADIRGVNNPYTIIWYGNCKLDYIVNIDAYIDDAMRFAGERTYALFIALMKNSFGKY